jgi:hypothetical protein
MNLIMLPDHPNFGAILHSKLPPGWQNSIDSDFSGTFCVRADTGLLEPLSADKLDEYLDGGEYDELELDDDD